MIGTRLANRYEIVGELGRGGMGVVYRARDPVLSREVAVKLVPPALLTPHSEERFQREAQVVAQMDHPAIVAIYDLGQHEGSLFFLMPVVAGTNLRSFLREQPRSLGEVLDIIVQVADALEYAHAQGIIHRDIKPENIMVSEEKGRTRVRVMDFGLARAATENRLTKTGTLLGTISYLSPEQVVSKDVDGRSDVYSLGTVLYECLTSEPPFTGETQTILYRIVHELPRSLRSLGADIGEELDDIVLRCLAKDPAKRYQRAGELAEALRRYQSKLHESERSKSVVLSTMMTGQLERPTAAPFVGREKEVAELQRRLNAATDGECQFVVVAGAPGIGKTRLLEEIENLAKARKIRVLHGRFVEQDRAFSYQGFCEVIQEYFRLKETGSSAGDHPDLSDLAADLVSIFPVLSEVSEIRSAMVDSKLAASAEPRKAEDRTYIYELLARTITRLAAGKPLLLVFENLHGAEMSLEALRYVVRRLGPTPTLIAGTYRQTEVDKRHPLVQMLEGFRDDPRFASITLGPFSPSEHRLFVESVVGSKRLTESLAKRLYEATEANPFFTKELVRSLVESGGIARDDSGAWTLSGEMAISSEALPATIQQTVEKRIERLPGDLREVLSIASVLGKSFEFRDLELLAEDRGDVDEIVERLVREGLIEEERESRGDRLTFSSGIVRDVLYGALSRRKRKSLHRKYAEQLEKRHAGRLDRISPQLVHHFSEGDVPEKTVRYGLEVARKSLDAFSAEETVHVIKRVLEFLEDEEWAGDRSAEGEARMLLASAHRQLGNLETALREAELAVRIFERERDAHGAVRAILLAAETAWQGRKAEETRRWLAQGIDAARAASDVDSLSKLLSLGATVANLRGEYARAKEYLDEAERLIPASKERPKEEAVPQGGTLVVALANPAVAREPAEMGVDEEAEILALVFETLVSTDEQGNLVPSLCEKWDFLEEGRSLLVTLRRGARFHDGNPLTARDVKTSFERAIRLRRREMSAAFVVIRGVAEFHAGQASEVDGLVVRSDRELEIRISEPLPIYPAFLTDPTTGIVRAPESPEGAAVIGTGPFRLAAQEPNRILLEGDPGYWKGAAPPLGQIEFRIMPSAAAIAAGLRSGVLDLGRDLEPQDLDDILRDPRFRTGLVEAPKKNTYFMVFNSSAPAVGDAALRRAVCGIVSTHDLVWRTLGRLAQPASGLIPPGILGHDPGKKRKPLTRDQALEILRSGGVALPVRLRASVHPLFQDRYRSLTAALLAVWADLGVEVSIATPSMEAYLDSFQNNEPYDLMIGRWNADYDDPDNFTNGLFHSGNGVFASFFSSAEADVMLEEARVERRPAARETLYRRFENLLIDSAALLPLFHDIDYRISSPKVRGLRLKSSPPYVNYAEVGKVEEAAIAAAAVRAAGGVLHIPVSGDVKDLEPVTTNTVEKAEVVPNVFETLMRPIEGARIVPWLASEVRVEDAGRRFRFLIRPDVRFHDGRRLTARDVRYSYERLLLNTEAESRWKLAPVRGARRLLEGAGMDLEGFHIVSPTEFFLDLEEPVSFFPALISYVATSIVPEGTDEVTGTWREQCVGTGPFRVVRFEPGRLLELERNPSYWRGGYPKSDGIVFRFGVSPEEIRSEFRAGRFSLASALFPADIEEFRHDAALASGYREIPRLSIYYVAFNRNRGPLADVALRRRLVEGIDVVGLVRRTLGRLAIPANGIIPPGLVGYAQAPTLSRSAAAVGPAGQQGAEIELSAVVHPMFFGEYSAVAKELFGIFAAKGVQLAVVNKTMSEFLQAGKTGSTDVVVGRWIGDYPDADTFVHGMLHSQGGSIGRHCGSPELDRLIERGRIEMDARSRHSIYREVEETVARDALLLPLFHEQVYRFARPEVEGLDSLNFSFPEVSYENLRIRR
jgi:ABC-type transport system substrate-binding protein